MTKPRAKPADELFPLTIKRDHAVVKIYRMKQRSGWNYAVTFVTQEGRIKRNFADLELARREADTVVVKLARGDLEALKLTGRERQLYVAASEAIAHTGMTLDVVAREFARAYDLLGSDRVLEAVRDFKARAQVQAPSMLVSEAVARFVAAKAAEGISPHYRQDLRRYLEKGLAQAFPCDLAAVTGDGLRAYLNAMKCGPVAKNNHRRVIVALFNFAKAARWLPSKESTAADGLGSYKEKERDVTIYTPAEVSKLLEHADEDFLPWLALIAFGGLRHHEIRKGLPWSAIDFDKGTLIVPAAIAKTGRKRKLDMPDNLRAWLKPYQGRGGAIFDKDPDARIGKTAAAAGISWKRNALRHSFGSYRMESVKNAGRVSLEMGNSPAMVMSHYFEIVDASAAAAYWNLYPESPVLT